MADRVWKARLSKSVLWGFLSVLGGLFTVSCGIKPSSGPVDKMEERAGNGGVVQEAALAMRAPEPLNENPGFGLPLTFFNTADFVGSGRCSFCHGNLRDAAGRNMSINDHWRSAMMANASKDPLWQAKVVSETKRSPGVKNVIEKKCVTCHMPMAWTQFEAGNGNYNGNVSHDGIYATFISQDSSLHEAAMDGVSCSLCHQIRDKQLGTEKTFSGKYPIETGTSAPDRPVFGPYKEAVTGPMRVSVGYTPEYGIHTNDSALCGTCHTLYTPYLDGEGKVAGTFPEQTPYLEWLHSKYGEDPGERHDISETKGEIRTCQECHMPHSKNGDVLIANPSPPEAKMRDHFSQHYFVGGNVLLLNIMHDNASSLGLTASPEKMEATRMRTLEQLRSDTALLELLDTEVRNETLSFDLKVESLVGHKFPTGFPSRRAWLHVRVLDKAGDLVFESGKSRPDGSIIGDNADEGKGYEPHYNVIDTPEKVQIYESTMVNTDGEVTYTLLRAAGYIKDNRLLPPGFDKNTAGPDIAVCGSAAEDGDFIGGRDDIRYMVPLDGHEGPFTVKVALNYTTVSHAFMSDLRRDEELKEVDRFVGYFDQADKTPTTVAVVGLIVAD